MLDDVGECLFETVEDALKFAFRFCSQQYARGPLQGPPIGSGKGLVGNDGAAQAGMINREARELGTLLYTVLFVRHADQIAECPMCRSAKPADDWRGHCKLIAEEMRKELAPEAHITLMTLLVERHFSCRKTTLTEIAARFGDGDSKVKHISAALGPALRALEGRATRKLGERLRDIRLVAPAPAEEVA